MPKILVFTDKAGISQGYRPAWGKLLMSSGILMKDVTTTDIYGSVKEPLGKYRNTTLPRFMTEKLGEIHAAANMKIKLIKPDLIVVTCPAVLGVLVRERSLGSIEKTRGGLYYWPETNIPCIVTFPITAINQRTDSKGDVTEGDQVYKVKDGNWILLQDWRKIGRFHRNATRKLPKFQYTVCRTIQECEDARDWLAECKLIAYDIETYGTPAQISCIGFTGITAAGHCHSFVIPFGDKFAESGLFFTPEDHVSALDVAAEILNSPVLKTAQNGSYDNSYLIRDRLGVSNYLLDSIHLWHALYPELAKTLDFITSILLDNYQYWKDDIKGAEEKNETFNAPTMEGYWRYNALDCYNTLWNTLILWTVISAQPAMMRNFLMEMRLNYGALSMSMKGLPADEEKRQWHRERLEGLKQKAVERIQYCLDMPDFNPRSPVDRSFLLYTLLGARPRDDKGRPIGPDSKKGPSTGAIPVKLAKSEHPFFEKLLNMLDDCVSPATQISNIVDMTLHTSRFRTSYGAYKTETWRLSSKASNFWDGGNAQNIRGEMRDWIVAEDGCFLMDCDYSQSDAVFVAYESNDPRYIQTMAARHMDSHATHAEHFFKIPYADIVAGKAAKDPRIVHPTKGIRNLTKRVVHGANFQMTGPTLYMTMGRDEVVAAAVYMGIHDAASWSEQRLYQFADSMLRSFRTLYPRLSKKGWYGEIAQRLVHDGFITNAFGYTRKFLGDPKDSGTQREATAFYGQSGTSGNINRTMDELLFGHVEPSFRDGPNPFYGQKPLVLEPRHGCSLRLQTHDSLTFNVDPRKPDWREGINNILTVMQRPVTINGHSVIVGVEAELGCRWGKSLVKQHQMIGWDMVSPIDLDRVMSTRN